MAIDVMYDSGLAAADLPQAAEVRRACEAALAVADFACKEASLCVRFAEDEEVRRLNRDWRGVDAVTDVLAFPMQEGPAIDPDQPLGDVVLAWPFVSLEAQRLGLTAAAHALHLVVHGCLHLLGYDHAEPEERERMRACERQAMRALGLHDPYFETAADV